MAKIYRTPDDAVPPPIPDYHDYAQDIANEADYIERLRTWARSRDSGKLTGKLVRTPVADGYAVYMILKHAPFSMLHLNIGDSWRAHSAWERGLRISDVKRSASED